jgi:hypothetical protein
VLAARVAPEVHIACPQVHGAQRLLLEGLDHGRAGGAEFALLGVERGIDAGEGSARIAP